MPLRFGNSLRKQEASANAAAPVEFRVRQHLPKCALQQVIIPAPTTSHATFNRGAVSRCGLFSTLAGWTDERARRFPFQYFTVPASKAPIVAGMLTHFYEEIGLKRPAIRLSPVFTKKKPWMGDYPLCDTNGQES